MKNAARRGALKTSAYTKTARSDDISRVNLIVERKELAKLTKMETSSIGMLHRGNIYVIDKPPPNKGFKWPSP